MLQETCAGCAFVPLATARGSVAMRRRSTAQPGQLVQSGSPPSAELQTIFRRARLQPESQVRLTTCERRVRPLVRASVMLHREFFADAPANLVCPPHFRTGLCKSRRAADALARSGCDRLTT